MTERESLSELIKQGDKAFSDKYKGKLMLHIDELYEFISDHILADGWIRLPCKVGDIVYFAHRFECRITEHKVENLYIGKRGMSIRVENLANPLKPYEIGKTVFLTKEEAEQALRKEDEGK